MPTQEHHRILMVHAAPGIPLYGDRGSSRHLREVVRAMAALGHDVTLVARRLVRSEGDPHLDLPCRVHHQPQGSLPGFLHDRPQVDESVYDLRLLRALRRMTASAAPSLVYERFSLFSTAGLRLARALAIPAVLEVNAPLVRERAEHEGLRVGPFTRRRERQILRGATRVVVVSSALRRHVTDLGVPPERVTVVPNGVDVDRFSAPAPGPADFPERAPDSFALGFCGSLQAWHDLGLVMEAMATDAALERVVLVVIGDGPSRGDLERRAAEQGIAGRVHWAGTRPASQVPAWLQACDAICVPYPPMSQMYFSPLKLVEAMAAGRPVVATDAGDLRAMAGGDDPAALLVPAGDRQAMAGALRRLMDDPQLRRQLGESGHARARQHSWRRVVERSLAGL